MANHFSALKRARQTTKRTATNRANTSRLRTALRTLRETIEKGDKQAAEQTYRQTVSALDKAIQKGRLHDNTAARYKSRLGVRVNAMKKVDEPLALGLALVPIAYVRVQKALPQKS